MARSPNGRAVLTLAGAAVLLLAQGGGAPDAARFEAAQRMQAEGRCREAIPALQELARAHPRQPAILLLLGRCHFDVKEYGAAESPLRQAVAAAPQSAEARFFLASALGLAGKMPEAIEQLQVATRLDPGFAPVFRVLGMFRFQSGHFMPETRTALETAVRLDPEDGRARYWLGRYLLEMREFAGAREQFERALSLMPQSSETRLAYAQTLSGLGQTERALAEFDAVLTEAPGSPAALLGRAKCLYAQQKSALALAAAERALKNAADPESQRDAFWMLARLYRVFDRSVEAETAGRKLAELDATRDQRQARFRDLQQQATQYHAQHNTLKVVEALEESLSIQERRDSLVMLGDAYMELGRVAEAEHCFLRALQAGPESAEIARRLELLRERSYKDGKVNLKP